jgi:hypothetical protein
VAEVLELACGVNGVVGFDGDDLDLRTLGLRELGLALSGGEGQLSAI